MVCAQAIHLRTNIEYEAEYLQRHKRARHCTDLACWARVADIFVACARGLGETSSILVTADDTTVVEAASRHAKTHFASVGAPPQDHLHHSGLTRPAKQLATERDKGVTFGHGGALGPLVDLLLLASAHTFVGTAGSSFSEQALAWGLVNRVTEPVELLPTCRALAEDMLSCVPEALRGYKRVIDEGFAGTYRDGLAQEARASAEHMRTVRPESVAERRAAVQRRGRDQSDA